MKETIIVVRGATLGKPLCIQYKKQGYHVLIIESDEDLDEADRFMQEVSLNHGSGSIDYATIMDIDSVEDNIGIHISTLEYHEDVRVIAAVVFTQHEDYVSQHEIQLTRMFQFEFTEDEEFNGWLNELNDKYRFSVLNQQMINKIKCDLKRFLIYREDNGTPLTHLGNIINNFSVHIGYDNHKFPSGKLNLIPETL